MRLNHPKTIPPTQSVEKLSSTKPVPGAKKVGEKKKKKRLGTAALLYVRDLLQERGLVPKWGFDIICRVGQSEPKPWNVHHIENLYIYSSTKNTD